MRKLALSLLFVLIVLLSLFAGNNDGTVYFSDSGRDTRFNLNMDFYPILYSSTWGKYNFTEGAYNSNNWLGIFGVKSVPHKIKITVSTGDGRFVSQSDPTKYRDFYVAMKPIYNSGGDKAFMLDVTDPTFPEVASGSRVPTTKNESNSVTVYTYKYSDNANVDVGNGTKAKINMFYFDILLCLDVLQAEDYLHMSEADDYVGTITLTWECMKNGCTVHSGSSVITLSGYYDSSVPKDSTVDTSAYTIALSVNPTVESSRLDLKQMLTASEKAKIADLLVSTSFGGSWLNNVRVFISSSQYYNVGGSSFQFVNINDSTKTIPFNVEVFDSSTAGSWSGTPNKTYDGTNYWVSTNASASMCLDLSSSQWASKKRGDGTVYQILYSGDVVVSLKDENNAILNDITNYSGSYKSNIYYHLVYDK